MKRILYAVLLATACSTETLGPGPGADAAAPADDAAPAVVHDDAAAVVNEDAADATHDDAAMTANDAGTVTSTGDPSVLELDLGTVHLTSGTSSSVRFTLPDGTASFMIVIDGADDIYFIPYTLDGPGGNLVSDDASGLSPIERFVLGPYGAQFKSNNRVTQDMGLSASLFPNNPATIITGGDYRLVVGGMNLQGNGTPHTGDVTVKVYYRKAIPAASSLDLNLYFTGAGSITATSAPTNMFIQDAITALRGIYAQAGVTVGTVSYHAASARFQTITGFDGSGRDLEDLFEESNGNGRGLHFFFVDRFMGGFPGATVAGIAGGLPGAPDHVGSLGAGVAVSISAANGDPGILAHVMAHEGGHWLGLFHTSEITGTLDQHPETPEGMGGQNHLMYPAVGGGTTISPSQGQVMRLHGESVAR